MRVYTYCSEETAKKLVKLGFYETVLYFKIAGRNYPKIPDPNELVEWLRKNKDVYIVVVPDPRHPLRHLFNYFVYAPDNDNGRPRLVSEGVHFNYDDAIIDAIIEYLNKEVL